MMQLRNTLHYSVLLSLPFYETWNHHLGNWVPIWKRSLGLYDSLCYSNTIMLCYFLSNLLLFPTPACFTWHLNCEVESAKKEKQLAALWIHIYVLKSRLSLKTDRSTQPTLILSSNQERVSERWVAQIV